jgi:hypothetical protein
MLLIHHLVETFCASDVNPRWLTQVTATLSSSVRAKLKKSFGRVIVRPGLIIKDGTSNDSDLRNAQAQPLARCEASRMKALFASLCRMRISCAFHAARVPPSCIQGLLTVACRQHLMAQLHALLQTCTHPPYVITLTCMPCTSHSPFQKPRVRI